MNKKLMNKKLKAAIRTIREHCDSTECWDCPFQCANYCYFHGYDPCDWMTTCLDDKEDGICVGG